MEITDLELVILSTKSKLVEECQSEHPFRQQYKTCYHTKKLVEMMIKHNDLQILALLYMKRIDFDNMRINDQSVLDMAFSHSKKELTYELLNCGVSVYYQHIAYAILLDWHDLYKILIDRFKYMKIPIEYDLIVSTMLFSNKENRHQKAEEIMSLPGWEFRNHKAIGLLNELMKSAQGSDDDVFDDVLFYAEKIEPKLRTKTLDLIDINDISKIKDDRISTFLLYLGYMNQSINDLMENGELLIFNIAKRGKLNLVKILLEMDNIKTKVKFVYKGNQNSLVNHLKSIAKKTDDKNVEKCWKAIESHISKA